MSQMREAKRKPGSEWLKDRPRFLEKVYDGTWAVFRSVYPMLKRAAPEPSERFLIWLERVGKGYVFNCQMCGQCVLHSTGMTCPMNCPKNLRNGPCGGVRHNGHCEVIPDMKCVWFQAWERDRQMETYSGEIRLLLPPLNRSLQDSSSWINMFEGTDQEMPPGWATLETQKEPGHGR